MKDISGFVSMAPYVFVSLAIFANNAAEVHKLVDIFNVLIDAAEWSLSVCG